jgi:hypothetical protein
MDVAFRRQPFGGRGELHFIRAADDDAVAWFQTALEANEIAVAGGDLDIASSEALTADLNEDVRAASLEQDRGLWYRGKPHAVPLVEDGGSALSDEQLAPRIVDLELHRQRVRRRVEDAGVVHVMRPKRDRIGAARNFERQLRDSPVAATSAVGTCARSST